jgi:hypothetical protein
LGDLFAVGSKSYARTNPEGRCFSMQPCEQAASRTTVPVTTNLPAVFPEQF